MLNAYNNSRQESSGKYASARLNLLIMIILSAVNIFTLASGIGSYFLFSAAVPYNVVRIGMYLCGMYPAESYEEGAVFLEPYVFVMLLISAIGMLGIYLLCWLFSKNGKTMWLKIALGMFILDTLVTFVLYGLSNIIDLGFHIWLIVIMVQGLKEIKLAKGNPYAIEAEYTDLGDENTSEPVEDERPTLDSPEKTE